MLDYPLTRGRFLEKVWCQWGGFLPAMISENLDFATLQMENTAYISADLRDYFSDVSYSCH